MQSLNSLHDVSLRAPVNRFAAPRVVPVSAMLLLAAGFGCGFGTYDDSSSPGVTGATSGVPDAGQWWPFVCPDGSNPSPDEPPQSFTVAGTCGGDGGILSLNVDGCELFANWDVLGLTAVETTVPTDTPNLGGWAITASPTTVDAGWTCSAGVPSAAGSAMTFSCAAGSPSTTTCESTLTPVSGS